MFDAVFAADGVEEQSDDNRQNRTVHRSLRAEFLSDRTPFANLTVAQHALDAWAADYNTARTNNCTWPHTASDSPPRCPLDVRHHRELKNAAQHRLGLTGHGWAVRRAH
jgi:hypothetical protein